MQTLRKASVVRRGAALHRGILDDPHITATGGYAKSAIGERGEAADFEYDPFRNGDGNQAIVRVLGGGHGGWLRLLRASMTRQKSDDKCANRAL